METKVQDFVDWMKRKHSVDVEATRRIEPGELLVRIPISALLTTKAARAAWVTATPEILEVKGEEFLWLYMIWGRKELSCDWYPYLQILPSDPLPWLRSAEALRWLRGTSLETAAEVIAQQEARHAELRASLGEVAGSFEDWLWARHCYLSRSFDQAAFPRSEDWESAAMCPLLDSMNHQPDAEVEARYGEETAGLWLPDTASPYEEGEEVFHLYKGQADNETLLLNYGFALPENPYDVVDHVIFPFEGEAERWEALEAMPSVWCRRGRSVLLRLSEALTSQTLEVPTELLRAAALLRGWDYQEELASCRQKAKVCRWLLEALRHMLQSMAFQEEGKLDVALVNLSGTLGRFAAREALRRAQARKPKAACCILPGHSSISRATAQYALGQFLILHKVAGIVQETATMAMLAARMEKWRVQVASRPCLVVFSPVKMFKCMGS
ncbi:unnamed protein product [Durusdinium trenchii]|uniref:SET domain-containing protein n=1 Tax=Durusdinium trenchii TaxID=1381693 RepID=A0ABP0MXW1_9DINO